MTISLCDLSPIKRGLSRSHLRLVRGGVSGLEEQQQLGFPHMLFGSRDTRTSPISKGHFFPIPNLPTASPTAKMALLSSKTLIQAHAVLLIVIAGYLVKNPNYITDSDLVFMMGEALKIDFPVATSPTQSPFVFCSVLLFAGALVDMILLSSLPYHEALDEALPYIRPLRNSNLPAEDLQALARLPEYITRSLTMYWNVWVSISGLRFALYGGISFFIYQSRGSYLLSSYTSKMEPSGLEQLKSRVVFTYAFMEMMVWFWVFITCRDERQQKLSKLLEDAREEAN
ncbi:hypothetical protein PEBR_32347 [Penicillium brasilianum]|uniref:Increased loss of mitochondrial DNA protein 1 n=1 Tax=Penicillium brasilianum TaxID=104259 RepID=A0A1S9REQ3_PENBI|nr:hypothetical protein PEBR_32347 [Penicillium brasilianum]